MSNYIKHSLFIFTLCCSIFSYNMHCYAKNQYYISYGTTGLSQCLENSGASYGNMNDMISCYDNELVKLDKILNIEYKKIINALKKDNTEESKKLMNEIKEAQKAWIKYVDTFGRLLYDPNGGQAASLGSSVFVYRETLMRLGDLMDLIDYLKYTGGLEIEASNTDSRESTVAVTYHDLP